MVLIGDSNPNEIHGMGRDDTIEGRAGGDRLYGGDGMDTVSYATSLHSVNVSFISRTASGGDAQGDVLFDFEHIIGSDSHDILTGDNGINRIDGRGGDDILEGRGGADAIHGDGGTNTLSYAHSPEAVMVNLGARRSSGGDAEGDTFTNIQNIIGSIHNDTLIGDNNVNDINGGDGNDVIEGRGGADLIDGGAGSNTVSYAGSPRSVGINLVTNENRGGDAEGDSLTNIQNVLGSDYADILTGDAKDNILNGAYGNDWLEGGGGNDLLIGGTGSDTFKIDSKSTNVMIQDFEINVDKIDLLDFSNLHRASHLTQTRTQNGMLISSSDFHILLQNIAQPLSNDQFIFNPEIATQSWWTYGRISIISSVVGGIAALVSIAYTLYQCKKGARCFKKKADDYYAMDELESINTPIGIALDSKPIELISLEKSQTSFDYLDNGVKLKTAWVGPRDAFLVYDHNDNHKVDFAKELVLTQWTSTAKTDFMALKEVFDSNHDNKFDVNDAEFNRFLIWQDKNQDGISQSNELTSLPEAGLVQIDFDTERTVMDEFFNKQQEMQIAGVHWADGRQTMAYDLALYTESLA